MDKNFVIGILLIFAWILLYQTVIAPPVPPEEVPVTEEQQTIDPTQTPAKTPTSGDTALTPADGTPTPPSKPAAPESVKVAKDGAPPEYLPTPEGIELKTTIIENDIYNAVVSSHGGLIRSFTLKDFSDKAGPEAKPYDIIWTASKNYYPLTTEFIDTRANVTHLRGNDRYEPIESENDDVLKFRRVCKNGLEVIKTYNFDRENYLVTLDVSLKNLSSKDIQGKLKISTYANVSDSGSFFKPNYNQHSYVAYKDGKLESELTAKIKPELKDIPGQKVSWAGFTSSYFVFAVAPEDTGTTLFTRLAEARLAESVIMSFNQILSPGEVKSLNYTSYIGPKQEHRLQAAGHGFEWSRDFGWFSGIARFLVRMLNFFYKFIPNYGVAIIIVTIIIKIVLYPLTLKSFKSMKAMSKLQPEIKALKEQYGDDKNTMNQKTMELYRKHKVNPAAGCLPMLLQLPIFLAFYRALASSIELRHAPFFGWIQDLSAPDPYYVTPIIMGATMVLTQKLTPTSADPMQQKMMMAMPIVFTFIFLSFPSGLVIYWLMSNVLSIFQQLYINRQPDDDDGVQADMEKVYTKRKKRK